MNIHELMCKRNRYYSIAYRWSGVASVSFRTFTWRSSQAIHSRGPLLKNTDQYSNLCMLCGRERVVIRVQD